MIRKVSEDVNSEKIILTILNYIKIYSDTADILPSRPCRLGWQPGMNGKASAACLR